MPLYNFKDEKGSICELFFDMDDVAAVGQSVEIEGKKYIRCFSNNRVTQADANRAFGAKWPYCSDALPRWTRPSGSDLKFDSVGRPIIRNKSHEADIASRMDMQVGGVEGWGE